MSPSSSRLLQVAMPAASGAFGVMAASLTALATSRLVPEVRAEARWAVVSVLPFGLIAGLVMAGFLQLRATHVRTFSGMVLEATALSAVVALVASQMVIPVAWNLPRGAITALAVLCSAGFGAMGTWLLKPLYWSRG
jgi:hypothetical protein